MNPVDEIFQAQEKIFSASFDKARTYSQVVSGIGYAGIFASWTFTKPFLSRGEILWSALLATLSIMAFVLFEVLTTFVTSRAFLGLAAALTDKDTFLEVLEENRKKDRRLLLIYAKAWAWIWMFSFSTGVAAACILLGAFVGHLWTGR